MSLRIRKVVHSNTRTDTGRQKRAHFFLFCFVSQFANCVANCMSGVDRRASIVTHISISHAPPNTAVGCNMDMFETREMNGKIEQTKRFLVELDRIRVKMYQFSLLWCASRYGMEWTMNVLYEDWEARIFYRSSSVLSTAVINHANITYRRNANYYVWRQWHFDLDIYKFEILWLEPDSVFRKSK